MINYADINKVVKAIFDNIAIKLFIFLHSLHRFIGFSIKNAKV